MRLTHPPSTAVPPVRRPAVAGSFYPVDPGALAQIVDRLLAVAPPEAVLADLRSSLAGIVVPHAGLAYSGGVAAAGWGLAASVPWGSAMPTEANATIPTIVILGTNHSAAWLDGVGIWDSGVWQTPIGDVEVDDGLAAAIEALGQPFMVDRDAHRSEHSIEVQLPFVARAMPGVRIVPLAVGTGRGAVAVRAGDALGRVLADRRTHGERILLAISTDMAHYPAATIAARITDELASFILALDTTHVASAEAEIARSGLPGVVCAMCGIEPTIVGLAALRAMGVEHGVRLGAATSADAGGPSGRTVGYLAAAFPG
jgi:MEMO1 family protein